MSALAVKAAWPAPAGVHAWASLRAGGVSSGPFASLNVAAHVGDDASSVAENRTRLSRDLELPSEPVWLTQVHGNRVAQLSSDTAAGGEADAAMTREPGVVCAVLTADCLPVVLTNRAGSMVGVAHAGWRGLAAGVLENAVSAMGGDPADLLAWLGPGISAANYEVGDEVRDAFSAPGAIAAFTRNERGRWQADLYALARLLLAAAGVESVHGGNFCTLADEARFFSHRRSAPCGRMATLIWRS